MRNTVQTRQQICGFAGYGQPAHVEAATNIKFCRLVGKNKAINERTKI